MKETNAKQNGAGVKLSRRLSALAEWVPQGARFADIGTDHALLPVFLAGSGRISYAVAGDVHAGPADAARRQVAEAGLESLVSVRHGDGLSVLAPGEVDTVCIAGMGGSLIVRLLTEAGERLDGVRTLVLSPHVAEDQLRIWLRDKGFVLERELLLEEDGVIYTLLQATRGDSDDAKRANEALYDKSELGDCLSRLSDQLCYEMGPLLLRAPSSVFFAKWEQEASKREKIVAQMRKALAEDTTEKALEWEKAINDIREVLACLRAEKRSFN
ncbi:tRNA (adenine(22)-N(1))-methyltransferase [Cohnella faecalis]|uniref:SAM-dependent methyltransferase n=1 Tax=Cohnella faecalis TaxID=2315694 RepID=A0A398CSJ7_9BACL|nr:class I SAM-dependent methyltransferase [Cohnella faecalis]RIE04219.1 SAM-dependent methyltransferase [Cohnella faecalis]